MNNYVNYTNAMRNKNGHNSPQLNFDGIYIVEPKLLSLFLETDMRLFKLKKSYTKDLILFTLKSPSNEDFKSISIVNSTYLKKPYCIVNTNLYEEEFLTMMLIVNIYVAPNKTMKYKKIVYSIDMKQYKEILNFFHN